MLAVYVSGHGYGHSTRTAEVLRALRAGAPALPIAVSTSAPAFLFEGVVAGPLTVRRRECDVGLVQRDALVIDEEGTARAWKAFAAGWSARVATEAAWLRGAGARLVLGDIPPLAFAAARAAAVPSVALGNFSWDQVYRHVAGRQPALADAAAKAAEAYAFAERLLRLPFACDTSCFREVEDVPLVARRPAVARDEARRRLGLDGRPCVLLSFGGIGLPGLRVSALEALDGYRFVLTGPDGEGQARNVRHVDGSALAAVGLDYPDLVGACDIVVTKPGYGIVSDCIGAGVRLVYTERGDFPEYPVMVAEMPRYLPAVFAPNEDVREGRLGPALEAVRAVPFPAAPRADGAAVAAERLLGLLRLSRAGSSGTSV